MPSMGVACISYFYKENLKVHFEDPSDFDEEDGFSIKTNSEEFHQRYYARLVQVIERVEKSLSGNFSIASFPSIDMKIGLHRKIIDPFEGYDNFMKDQPFLNRTENFKQKIWDNFRINETTAVQNVFTTA